MKVVYILRAIPGSGKSTLAEMLCDTHHSSVICCADDYFTDIETGVYNWSADKIGAAHLWCQSLFKEAIADGVEIIVVANTSTRTSDVNTYRNVAIEAGYMVHVLTVENWHNGMDVHNVPEEIKEKMREALIKSIKL